ncbi:hypothetical protein [Virgisporangium aliadipatigenens]|uniref:hypothetical protein n=1 Tax=Virgisporangium aliadipatigenens TaxID=741659 RepID=UPI0019449021|nr:hypothetical protein [Virgisporangium aliadipatigenens]
MKAIVIATIAALLTFAAPAAVQASPAEAPTTRSTVTPLEEWVAYGYYFGLDNCKETGAWTVAYGLALKYRCIAVGLIIYRLEIVVAPIR